MDEIWDFFRFYYIPCCYGRSIFLVVTPVGLIMRFLGKDLLRIKKSKFVSTYWISREKQNNTMKRQF
ncbi:uncharacterized protein METZ01_LOCUS353000 [marine metagenome]|uniref:Uncharacterized protein n=1 Tax=marine metagenome TaxID=408172 RepID=A0A382RR60_9ZZZZ